MSINPLQERKSVCLEIIILWVSAAARADISCHRFWPKIDISGEKNYFYLEIIMV